MYCRFISTLDPIDNDYAIAKYDFENPIYQAEDEGEEGFEVPRELARLLEQEEKTIQPHEEPIEVVNIGTDEEKKEIKIGAELEDTVKQRLIQMLQDNVEIFAWSYEDMPGDPLSRTDQKRVFCKNYSIGNDNSNIVSQGFLVITNRR